MYLMSELKITENISISLTTIILNLHVLNNYTFS